jgi:hypothetical protein
MNFTHRSFCAGNLLLNKSNISTLSTQNRTFTLNNKIMSNNSKTFESLNFDNLVLRTLPIDPIKQNYVREVKNACFSLVTPTSLKKPVMVVYSKKAMQLLGLDDKELKVKFYEIDSFCFFKLSIN